MKQFPLYSKIHNYLKKQVDKNKMSVYKWVLTSL